MCKSSASCGCKDSSILAEGSSDCQENESLVTRLSRRVSTPDPVNYVRLKFENANRHSYLFRHPLLSCSHFRFRTLVASGFLQQDRLGVTDQAPLHNTLVWDRRAWAGHSFAAALQWTCLIPPFIHDRGAFISHRRAFGRDLRVSGWLDGRDRHARSRCFACVSGHLACDWIDGGIGTEPSKCDHRSCCGGLGYVCAPGARIGSKIALHGICSGHQEYWGHFCKDLISTHCAKHDAFSHCSGKLQFRRCDSCGVSSEFPGIGRAATGTKLGKHVKRWQESFARCASSDHLSRSCNFSDRSLLQPSGRCFARPHRPTIQGLTIAMNAE